MAYTPGPWIIGKNGGEVISSFKEGLSIGGAYDDGAIGYYGGYLIGESISKCNLPLISAAPDLLEAAKHLIEDAIDRGECFDEETGEMYEDWKALQQAINKAEEHG